MGGFGRFAAAILLRALRSHAVRAAGAEIGAAAGRQAAKFFLQALRSRGVYNDNSGARRIAIPESEA